MKRYNLNQSAVSVNHFVLLLSNDDLNLDAEYQRGHVWGVDRQRALIFSILAGLPVSAIIVNDRFNNFPDHPLDEPGYAVIDGKQRITAMRAFMNDEFSIPAEWVEDRHLPENAGESVTYSQLGTVFDRKFKGSPVAYVEAQLATVDEERRVFDLINFGGVAQGQSDFDTK